MVNTLRKQAQEDKLTNACTRDINDRSACLIILAMRFIFILRRIYRPKVQ